MVHYLNFKKITLSKDIISDFLIHLNNIFKNLILKFQKVYILRGFIWGFIYIIPKLKIFKYFARIWFHGTGKICKTSTFNGDFKECFDWYPFLFFVNIGRLTVNIPWKSIYINPVEIEIDEIYILTGPQDGMILILFKSIIHFIHMLMFIYKQVFFKIAISWMSWAQQGATLKLQKLFIIF